MQARTGAMAQAPAGAVPGGPKGVIQLVIDDHNKVRAGGVRSADLACQSGCPPLCVGVEASSLHAGYSTYRLLAGPRAVQRVQVS